VLSCDTTLAGWRPCPDFDSRTSQGVPAGGDCRSLFAEVAAGNRGLPGHLETMAAQEAGKPVRAGEDLIVDPRVACMLPELGRRRPAGTVILTPLGQQLCQQAHDYLAC
jgi:hypothetical protein